MSSVAPGRPEVAVQNARSVKRGRSSTRWACQARLTNGRKIAVWSASAWRLTSWCGCRPYMYDGTSPAIATSGTESSAAVATPVTAFIIPGPTCSSTTPTSPVARAYPSAAWAAACSWRAMTKSMRLRPIASSSAMLVCPQVPKMCRTPYDSSWATRASATGTVAARVSTLMLPPFVATTSGK